jgi:predicted amidohydrolase
MTSGRRLAAAQTLPRRGDVDANLEEHLRLVRLAAEEGAELLLFPELSLTGYELDLAADLAFAPSDRRLDPLADAASACGMTLVVGAPVRVDARLHLGAFILAPDRSIGLYTKHHLGAFPASANPGGAVPPAEATVFQAGALNPLVLLGEHVAAVAVCADTGRPSHPQQAAGRGADTYLASMFVIPADLEADLRNLRTYAARHSMAVALANYGGPSGGLPSAGSSAVWSPAGKLIAQLGAAGAGIVLAAEADDGWRGKALPAPHQPR